MAYLIRTETGRDILRGKVVKIIDGDRFELEVQEMAAKNPDSYDKRETILVASLSIEEDGSSPEDIPQEPTGENEGFLPRPPANLYEIDGEDMDGTPDESVQESGRAFPEEFYGVRLKEELEAKLGNGTVDCTIRYRDSYGELIADVTVL